MEKIVVSKAVLVEGKYDKIKLSSLIDGVILTTNGFGIYHDKELRKLVRTYAKTRGLIVMTDSDRAGRQIRAFVKQIVPKEDYKNVTNIHIPQIKGKEKRKDVPSKEGTLGVEGIDADVLRSLLKDCIENAGENSRGEKITKADLFELGLSGGKNSGAKREELCRKLSLPLGLSTPALLDLLNSVCTKEELLEKLSDSDDQ